METEFIIFSLHSLRGTPSRDTRGAGLDKLYGVLVEEAVAAARIDCKDVSRASDLGNLYAESGQTLQGSFSAVSKPNFANK